MYEVGISIDVLTHERQRGKWSQREMNGEAREKQGEEERKRV